MFREKTFHLYIAVFKKGEIINLIQLQHFAGGGDQNRAKKEMTNVTNECINQDMNRIPNTG